MTAVKRPCLDCGVLIPLMRESRCPACERRNNESRWQRGLTGSRGSRGNWKRMRAKALKRDRFRCVSCGTDRKLVVHHRDGIATNNALSNLVTLCEGCHRGVHRRP